MKKLLSTIFVIIALFANTQSIFATTVNYGTQKWVAGQYDSQIYTTDNKSNVGMLIRRLTNYNTGEKITTFCAEHYIDSPTGSIETGTHSVPTDTLMKKACKVAYFGWYSKYGDYAIDGGILAADMIWVREDYIFTQQYIWEVLGQSTATFKESDVQSRYLTFKNDVEQKIANIEKTPSFVNETITVDTGKSTILTDANGVLKDYSSIDKTVNGIRIVHNLGENTINVTVDENCNLESYKFTKEEMESYGLIKEETKNHNTTVYITFRDGVQDQLYAMNYNNPVSMSLNLQINSFGKLELSKLNTDGDLVDGAIFKITGENYNKEVVVTNGKITLDKLRKGNYIITEICAPEGYLLNTENYKVEIKTNETTKQAIVNKEPTGTFTLVKKNADKTATIEGAKYRIWNNNGYDKEFTTDKEGKIKVTGLKLGMYNYKETQAANGYLIDTNTYSFEVTYKDQYTNIVYANAEKTNEEPRGEISIIKKDSETGNTPQGDATFLNAIYEVYADQDIYNKEKTKKFYSKGDLVATRSINKDGTTDVVDNLPLGKYKVKEVFSSKGYLLDLKEYQINLEYQNQNSKIISKTITSYEQVKKMQVHIFKSGISENSGLVTGLEGAEFSIKLKSDVEKAYSQGYSYEEVWNGIDKFGNIVNVNKARAEEAQKIAPTYEKISTDKNGNAYTQKIPYGEYIVKETITPRDFETAKDFTFSITGDESEIKHLVVNNEPLETYIKLIKKDLKTNKTVTLSSSTFQIKATQDIYDKGTGKIIYKKGEIINQKVGSTTYYTFTTNADNIIVPEGSYNSPNDDKGSVVIPLLLPVGTYQITEIKAPEGFLQLEEAVIFKVEDIRNYKKNQNGDYIKEIVVKNEQPTGNIIINKSVVLREDVDTSLIDISDLSGIEFKLIAKQDIIDFADGSIIYEKGEEINTYNLDKNGNLKIENLPIGTYEIQEIKTLDCLVLNNTKYEIKFTQKDQITKVYEEKRKIENEIKDIPILKNIILVKLDSNTKEVIKSHFKFAIFEDLECTRLIEEVESNVEKGIVEFKDLRFGSYYVKEIKAPEGYYLSEEIIRIDINQKGVFINDKKLEEKNEEYILEYYNTLIPTIQTGIRVNYVLLLGLIAISIIGIVLGRISLAKLEKLD